MVQYVITGISVGSLYALLGLGLALTYRSTRVLNFAQGEFAMLLAFASYFLLVSAGLSWWPALLIVAAASLLLGTAVYNALIFPLRQRDEERLAIMTLGLKLAVTGVAAWWFGPGSRVFPRLSSVPSYTAGGIVIGSSQALAIVAGLAAMAMITLFLRYAPMGLAMRAAAENLAVAQLLGVNLRVVGSAAWVGAMLLGAVTGVLFASTTLLSPFLMGQAILKAFAALILGGMRSVPGVIAGGFIVGILESLTAYFISPVFQDSVSLVLIILVLLFKPEGLFGSREAWRA